jgi:multiple sugar transport system substrate-binding protein
MLKKLAFAMSLILVMVITACGPAATAAPVATDAPVVDASGVKSLTILWAQWSPADYLQEMGKQYETETGIKVTVVQEPWGSFGDRFNVAMAAAGTEWDMVVGDSQWIGQGVTAGYYVDLTDFMVSNGIDKSVTPATLQYYGEYPAGSGKYYGFPTEGDADGWAYRKDLFEDPANMAAFKTVDGHRQVLHNCG